MFMSHSRRSDAPQGSSTAAPRAGQSTVGWIYTIRSVPFIPKDKHTGVRMFTQASNSFISGWGPVERRVGVAEGAFDGKEVEKGRRGERDWVSAPRGLALIPPGNEIIIIIKKKIKLG